MRSARGAYAFRISGIALLLFVTIVAPALGTAVTSVAASSDRPSGLAVVSAAGRTVFSGDKGGAVRIRLTRPATISLRPKGKLGRPAGIRIKSSGQFAGLILRRAGVFNKWFFAGRMGGSLGSEDPFTWLNKIDGNLKALRLAPGLYDASFIAERAATVTLELEGLSGTVRTSPSGSISFGIQRVPLGVQGPEGARQWETVYSGGIEGRIPERGILFFAMGHSEANGRAGLAAWEGWCLYRYEPPVASLAYYPKCPSHVAGGSDYTEQGFVQSPADSYGLSEVWFYPRRSSGYGIGGWLVSGAAQSWVQAVAVWIHLAP